MIIHPTDKKTLRTQALTRRSQLTEDERQHASHQIEMQLLNCALIPENANVAGYCAIRGEMDVEPLLRALHAQGHGISLPTSGEQQTALTFRAWQPDTPLCTGKYGINEPDEAAASVTPDVLLVPLAGFDREGNRLGYGKGYYDATLHHLRRSEHKPIAIGIAHSSQELPLMRAEAHDQKLDAIITEKDIIIPVQKERSL